MIPFLVGATFIQGVRKLLLFASFLKTPKTFFPSTSTVFSNTEVDATSSSLSLGIKLITSLAPSCSQLLIAVSSPTEPVMSSTCTLNVAIINILYSFLLFFLYTIWLFFLLLVEGWLLCSIQTNESLTKHLP